VYEGDCICDLDLDGENPVGGGIRHFSQDYGLNTLLNAQFTRPTPEINSIVKRQFYELWFTFVFPEKWQSFIRLKIYRIDRFNLTDFYQGFSCIGEHIFWSDLNDSSKLIDVVVFD